MKNLFIATFLLMSTLCFATFDVDHKTTTATQSVVEDKFCVGFDDGYCEGYKDVKGQNSVCPVTPTCPVPEVGKDTYKGGYNTGFKAGFAYAKNH